MKKLVALVMTIILCFTLASCSGGNEQPDAAEVSKLLEQGGTTASDSDSDDEPMAEMKTSIDTMEYTLYQNVFYNDQKSEFAGSPAEKEGTFTTLYDAYNDTTRYYVWGYKDNTHCCDWQWELKIEDTSSLPANGSYIKVSGTYGEDENALDKFWIESPEISVETEYTGKQYDINMLTMSNTLERVQAANINGKAESFEGKTVGLYARMQSEESVTDPYYDNSWSMHISGDYEVEAFGTLVIITGTVENGVVSNAQISPNTQF